MLKKYLYYKRALQALLFTNVFLVGLGIAASVKYFETRGLDALEMALVGGATLLVGFVIPLYLIMKVEKQVQRVKLQTEKNVVQWLALYAQSQRSSRPVYQDPVFWMNVILLAAETLGPQVDHPVARFSAELAPLLREELQKMDSGSRKRTRKMKSAA